MSFYPPPGGSYPPQQGSFQGAPGSYVPPYNPPPGGSFMGPQSPAGAPGSFYGAPGSSAPPPGSFYGAPPAAGGAGSVAFGAPPPASLGWVAAYYQQITPQEFQELQRWFISVDQDRSNSISVTELQNLAFGGVPLGYEIALKLIKVFDQDFSGTIDFIEYASLHKFIQAMQGAFARADTNRNGQLDPREILAALHQGGMSVVSLPTIQALFRKHSRGRQEIGFSDFLGLVADIALLRTRFEIMDRGRTGYIQINLDALIQMSCDV